MAFAIPKTWSEVTPETITGKDLNDNFSALAGAIPPAGNLSSADTIADLKAITVHPNLQPVYVKGYFSPGDGGGGVFYADTSDTTSADNGGTIIVGTDGARWKRVQNGPINIKWFGAEGNGVTDDSLAIQAAIDARSGSFGGTILVPDGIFPCSDLVCDDRIQIVGTGRNTSILKNNSTSGQRTLTITPSGSTIQYFLVDGITFSSDNAGSSYLLLISSGIYGVVRNCFFSTSESEGLHMSNCYRVTVQDCNFLGQGTYGLFVEDSNACLFENINIADSGTACFRFANCRDCTAAVCGTSVSAGKTTTTNFELVDCQRVSLINCDTSDNFNDSLPLSFRNGGTGGCKHINLLGGLYSGNTDGSGIWCQLVSGLLISGVTLQNCSVGFQFDDASLVSVLSMDFITVTTKTSAPPTTVHDPFDLLGLAP